MDRSAAEPLPAAGWELNMNCEMYFPSPETCSPQNRYQVNVTAESERRNAELILLQVMAS